MRNTREQPENHRGYTDEDSQLDPEPLSPEQAEILEQLAESGVKVRDNSMFKTFEGVLPLGTQSLREYFDAVLPVGATFVEYGGPGRAVRRGFTEGQIALSVGVTLDLPVGEAVSGHTVIQGDVRSPDVESKVIEALGGAKPDLVLERMLRGLDVANFSQEEFIGLLERWYAFSSSRAVMLIQIDFRHNDAVKAWVEHLQSKFGKALEVVFFAGDSNRSRIAPHSALLIRKLAGAPPLISIPE